MYQNIFKGIRFCSRKQLYFSDVVHCLEQIQDQPSSLKKYLLFEMFIMKHKQNPNDIKQMISFCLHDTLFQQGVSKNDIVMPDNVLLQSLSTFSQIPISELKININRQGDIGEYAEFIFENYIKKDQQDGLLMQELYEYLIQLASIQGFSSEELKLNKLIQILQKCKDPLEVKYLFRFFKKKLRIGLSKKTIEKALKNENIKSTQGYENIEQEVFGYSLTDQVLLGNPVQPMLAELFETPQAAVDDFLQGEEGFCEFKYDGERIQVHYFGNGKVQLFSRSLDDRTWKYPILAQQLGEHLSKTELKSAVFDCEMICYNQDGSILPFQELQTQKTVSTEICLICFDFLYRNGECIMDLPLKLRQDQFKEYLKVIEGNRVIKFVKSTFIKDDPKQVAEIYNEALRLGLEGVMIKKNNRYRPGKRTDWCKLKQHKDLDLAVVGGFWGKGKRASFFGAYLLGVMNPIDSKVYPITKIGTGLSEKFMEESTNRMKQLQQIPDSIAIQRAVKPDVWFAPEEVWEVRYESITQSPKYYLSYHNSFITGLSLRFPRFLRIRSDKNLNEITTTEQLIAQYFRQTQRFKQE